MGIFIAFVAHIFFTYALFTANNKYITVFINLAPGITLFLFWIIFNNTIELQTALGIAINSGFNPFNKTAQKRKNYFRRLI